MVHWLLVFWKIVYFKDPDYGKDVVDEVTYAVEENGPERVLAEGI